MASKEARRAIQKICYLFRIEIPPTPNKPKHSTISYEGQVCSNIRIIRTLKPFSQVCQYCQVELQTMFMPSMQLTLRLRQIVMIVILVATVVYPAHKHRGMGLQTHLLIHKYQISMRSGKK
jgi:hypothetical protein